MPDRDDLQFSSCSRDGVRQGARGAGRDLNVTNTPPLGAPNTTVGSAAFGTITTAEDPRVIQLAVKFTF